MGAVWRRRWRTGGGRAGGWKSLRGERWDGQWVCCSGHCPPVSPDRREREEE